MIILKYPQDIHYIYIYYVYLSYIYNNNNNNNKYILYGIYISYMYIIIDNINDNIPPTISKHLAFVKLLNLKSTPLGPSKPLRGQQVQDHLVPQPHHQDLPAAFPKRTTQFMGQSFYHRKHPLLNMGYKFSSFQWVDHQT